ncbi:ribulose-phosphate 3-epimerase, partial [Turicimonas muris]
IRPWTKAPIDVHLMVEPVDSLIEPFAKAGADYITFHPEASRHVDRTLSLIRENGCKAGLVFNPATSLDWLTYEMDKIDMVLLMSVNPGFGGQSFLPETLHKLQECRWVLDQYEKKTGKKILLEVDGGVKIDNIAEIAAAGAEVFVAGSAVFSGKNYEGYKKIINNFRKELDSV